MSRTTVVWRGDDWQAKALPVFNGALTAAAAVGAEWARRKMNRNSGNVLGYLHGGRLRARRTDGRANAGRKVFQGAPPGGYPGVRTGHFRRSVRFASPEALGTPLRAAFGVGFDVPQARILEFGGIVRAKGRALAIPIIQADGTPGVILRRSVTIQARPWARPTARNAGPSMGRVFARTARAGLAAIRLGSGPGTGGSR